MKKLFALFIFTLVFTAPAVSHAAIDVDFETTPLFGVGNFLPGDTVSKTVTVTNNGTVTEIVQTELYSVVDGGLAEMVDVEITGGIPFSGSFDDFDDAGELELSSLDAGETIVYTFGMSFESMAGNPYQHKTLAFDICVGFKGGQLSCDTPDDPNYSQGSYGGGGYSQGSYGGGGYSQGSYGGGSYSQGSYTNGGIGGSDNGPIPQVLGAETSNFPFGAPNTGFGGLFAEGNAFPVMLVLFTALVLAGLIIIRRKLEKR